MKKGIIYCATSPSGKKYYGRTIVSLIKRKYSHSADVRRNSNTYFHNALRKYGIENFKWEIVEKIKDPNKNNLIIKLNEKEIFYIKEKNTLYPNGYNLMPGGNSYVISPTGKNRLGKSFEEIFGKEKAKEIKNKIGKGIKGKTLGRKQPIEERKRRALSNTGKKRTEETKEKTRQTMIGVKHTEIRRKNISEALKKFYSKK